MEFIYFLIYAYSSTLIIYPSGSIDQKDNFLSNVKCIDDNNCTVNAFCHQLGRCYCKKGFIPFRELDQPGRKAYHTTCLKEASFIGDYCVTEIQCQVPFGTHAECYYSEPGNKVGQCQCMKDSHYKDGLCHRTALIGGICEVNNNCLIKSPNLLAYCQHGHCICPPKYHPTADGSDCQLSSELGGPCIDDEGCAILNSQCRHGICICQRKYIANDQKNDCLSLAEKVGDPCEEHYQCNTFLSDTRCDKEKGVCICENNAHYIDGSCWKSSKLLEPCKHNAECLIDKSSQQGVICSSEVCQCKDGYALEEQSYCLKLNTTQTSSGQRISSPHVLVCGALFFLRVILK